MIYVEFIGDKMLYSVKKQMNIWSHVKAGLNSLFCCGGALPDAVITVEDDKKNCDRMSVADMRPWLKRDPCNKCK